MKKKEGMNTCLKLITFEHMKNNKQIWDTCEKPFLDIAGVFLK